MCKKRALKPLKEYEVRVRFVKAPAGHDWSGLDALRAIGRRNMPYAPRSRPAVEEELACPS